MFTPQRKGWALSPRVSSENPRKSKGKGLAGALESAPPPPPADLLGENGREGDGGDDVEVWRRFKDEGLLDESALKRRDREALASRILELENDLHEYQYNMGLLLIEKKEWSTKYEEIKLRLVEAEEILKREQAAHIIALSESEKREENLRKALGVEKQCVTDLEKALREMRAEIAEAKFTSDKKMAEALAMEASLEDKYLEVERKLHSADAKLAEASRKASEVDRKVEDVEAHERKVQREMFSLNSERKALEKDIAEQREHLREWEKKLQEGQKRLVDGQRFLNEREDRANETERVLKKKEEELEEARKMIETATNSLKNKEDDINTRLRALASKEKEFDVKMKNLEKKERALQEIEEKLNAREREEMQKLLDDHNAVLDARKEEFELELEKKRKSFHEEIQSKLDAMDKEQKEINRREKHISQREQALESKMEKLKTKEKDLDTKSKASKKWEESLKSDEKKLKEEKEQVMKASQELMISRTELESIRAAMKAEEQQVVEEKEKLKLTKEEREQHLQLQARLKQEIDDYRMMKESLVKEIEALREEREKFEREWEVLDEKRTAVETELKKVDDEKERFEKWRHAEQERLRNEELQAKTEIESMLADISLKKEAFENTMEHERSVAREDVARQLADVARELELRKHDLEMNMQKKQEEMEKRLLEKEKEFEMRREIEINRISSSISLNDSKIQKLKIELDRLDKEKEELTRQQKKLEADRLEIHKDIEQLRALSKNLKDQRAEFVKEKDRFLAAAERCKTCHNCGVSISELEVLDFRPSTETEVADLLLPSFADGFIEGHSRGKEAILSPQGTGSRSFGSGFLQKCSKLFKYSPGKNKEHSVEGCAEKTVEFDKNLDLAASEEAPNFGVANNSIVVVTPAIASDEQNGIGGSSLLPENDSQPETSKQRQGQSSRRGRPKLVKRTRSVKAVVQDAKTILGETSDLKVDGETNGDAKDSQHIDEESQGASVHTGQFVGNSRQKRRHQPTSEMTTSELEADGSEAHSPSVSMGGRRKRRQTSAIAMQTPGEKRYNLRRSTVASSVAVSKPAPDQAKGHKSASHQTSPPDNEISKGDHVVEGTSKNGAPDNEISAGDHVGEGTSKNGAAISPASGFGEENKLMRMRQNSTGRSIMEVSSKREMVEVYVESDVIKSVEISERTAEDGDEVDGAAATSELATPSNGSSSASEDDDYLEDDEERRNASIGKKLWKFLTT